MTKEEIIEMAKEVNLPYFWESGMPCNLEALKSFATLVAKKALETKDEPFEYWNAVGWFGYDTGVGAWFETNKGDDDSIPLYKEPPQREWVGLTDDEFNELYDKYVPESCYALLIEKVEAKLKEKNNG